MFERLGRMYADRTIGGVVLTGPAGAGKSRLAEELLTVAAGRPTARVVGHPATQSIPLGAMAHLLPADLTRNIGLGDDDRASLFHRARQHLAERAGSERLLVVADDVDQLDETSLGVLMPFTTDRSIFLVATIRAGRPLPSVIASLLKDEHVILMPLPPLTHDEVATLLHRALDGPVDTRAAERLAIASNGNLQILRELVHLSLDQGALREQDELWCLDEMPTSSTLEELITSQLAELEPQLATVLEMLALAGQMGLSDIEEMTDSAVLLRLEERGLIQVGRDQRRAFVALSHPMYGEVIRARLTVLRERQLFRLLADRLVFHGARRRGDAMQLARWRLEAGGEISVEELIEAGRLAVLGREPELAARFAMAAADRGRPHEAALISVESAILRGAAPDVERAVAAVWDSPTLSDANRSHLARRLARTRFFLGDLDNALAALEAGDRRLNEPGPIAAVRAERALLLATNGRPLEALRLVAEIGDNSDPRIRIDLATAQSIACLSVGRFDEAIAVARVGARTQEELPDWLRRRGAASHLINEAHALGYSGRFREGRQLVSSALVRARNAHAHAAIVWFEVGAGEIERDSGHGHAAVQHFSAATELAEHAGQQAALVWAWVGVAQGHLLLGDVAQATGALDRADAVTSPIATSWSTRERTRAWLLAARGELASARQLLVEVGDAVRPDGLWNFETGVVHDLVRFGDPGAAVERLDELARIVEGPYVHALAVHARAATDEDLVLYGQAIDEFEAMECLALAAEAATELAELYRRAGDPRAAAAMGQRALRSIELAGGVRTPGLMRGSGVEPLTAREREVAMLAAGGLSSKGIAERLIVSKRTVDSHLDRVYRKLGVTGRDQITEALLSTDRVDGSR